MVGTASIVNALLSGLTQGMVIFIIAVGLTLIFGVLDVINFAHGSMYMLGAYCTFWLVSWSVFSTNFWVAVVLSMLVVAVIGGIIERILVRPIYDQDHIFQLLLTFALVLIIDNGVRIIWGTEFRSVTSPEILSGQIKVFGVSYPMYNIFLIIAGIALTVAMWQFLERTNYGMIIRAASQDREIADAMGINVSRVFTGTFIFGSALAGLGGALVAPYRTITPIMGETIIVESFIVVIIGGVGSFAGALVGALLLGFASSFGFVFLGEFEALIPFVLLAVTVLIRPSGIFGGDEI